MAKPGNPRKEILQKAENIKALEQEEEARQRRMKIRQEREARARADQARARAEVEKKKAGRALKLAGLWIGLIIVIFFAAVWFSPDFVNWLHDMVN